MGTNWKHFRIGIAIACLLVAAIPVAIMAATTPGTKITATGTAKYYSSSGSLMPTATSNTVTTTVGQIASVSVSPASATKQVEAGTPASFGITVTNAGNGSDTLSLSTTVTNGSAVSIYKDANSDGQWQSTETSAVTSTGALTAGGTFKCIVVAKPSSTTTSETVTFTAKSQFDSTKTAQSTLTVQSGSLYVRSRLINGYYSNSDRPTLLTKDYLGGESSITPSTGSTSGGKTWTRVDSPTEYVDLIAQFGSVTYCTAYAHVYVYSPAAQKAVVKIGSNDGVKVWVNGTVVWTNDVGRAYTADSDTASADLIQGWNRALVKVCQEIRAWGFSVKFCDASGNPIPGLLYSTEPPTGTDTTPPVISNVNITPGITTGTVEWDTDEPASALVDYGATSSLGESYTNDTLVTHHSATLSDLMESTTYYVEVGSADASSNIAWNGGHTFKTTQTPPTNTNPYITSWLLNGYYKNSRTTRMSTDYLGGEASVAPTEGSTSGGRTWFIVDSTKDYIDLKGAFGAPTGCAGYACAYVYSPTAKTVNLWMGSDDGIKVWLNGVLVWNNDVYRSMRPDQDKKATNLAAGWNRLLVKVTQADQGWGFTFRLCDASGNAIPGLAYATAPN